MKDQMSFLLTCINRIEFLARLLTYLEINGNEFPLIVVLRTKDLVELKRLTNLSTLSFKITLLEWHHDNTNELADLYLRLLYGAANCSTKLISWLPVDDIPNIGSYRHAASIINNSPGIECAHGSMIDFMLKNEKETISKSSKQVLFSSKFFLTGKHFASFEANENSAIERLLLFNSSRHNFSLIYSPITTNLFIKCVSACASSKLTSWRWTDRLHTWIILLNTKIVKVPPLLLHQADGIDTGGYEMVSKEPTDLHWLSASDFENSLKNFKNQIELNHRKNDISEQTLNSLLAVSICKNTLNNIEFMKKTHQLLCYVNPEMYENDYKNELSQVSRHIEDAASFLATSNNESINLK